MLGQYIPPPDNAQHHAINAVAAAAPLVSWLADAPAYLTLLASVLGVLWYLILIGEKFYGWWKKK